MPRGVNIFLDRRQYESQILLHGQYVIRKAAQACPCIDSEKNSANPDCELCHGEGTIYYDETDYSVIREKLIMDGNVGTTLYGDIISVDRIYDSSLSVMDFHGNQIIFNSLVHKSQKVEVDYTYRETIKKCAVVGTYKGHGIIEVPDMQFLSSRGSYISYEVVSATDLENLDTADDVLEVIDVYRSFVQVEHDYTIASIGDRIQMNIQYVKPQLMLVTGISEMMRTRDSYVLPDAEASLTVPNHVKINTGDVFTLITTQQAFSLVKEFHGMDVLEHYDVVKILRIIDERGNEYQDGIDYIQVGRDGIRILNDNMLIGKHSIKYLYRIMFRAMSNLPSLRYGENQPFPRRVMLKQYSRLSAETIRNI